MSKPHARTVTLQLPGGLSALVGITVLDEPHYPTPCEPDTRREPTPVELHQIAMAIVRAAYQDIP